MQDEASWEPRSFAGGPPEDAALEAAEVAKLLALAGIARPSGLWVQLHELATQQACDWAERSLAAAAPLSARDAAALGLRALAGGILSTPGQSEQAHAAAAACLDVCLGGSEAAPPPRRRRWGEGALPQPQPRPNPLPRSVGCY
jgi:hypothetical protein